MKKLLKKVYRVSYILGIAMVLIVIIVGCYNTADKKTALFSDDNGFLIQEAEFDTVDDIVLPEPEFVHNGKLFAGWDTNIERIQDHSNVKAEYIDVSGEMNVIAVVPAYGRVNSIVEVPIILCGDVNLCGVDLCMAFNPVSLRYKGVAQIDKAVSVDEEADEGMIYIRMAEADNVIGEMELCRLKFKIKENVPGNQNLGLLIKDAVAINDNEIKSVPCNAVESNVYIY